MFLPRNSPRKVTIFSKFILQGYKFAFGKLAETFCGPPRPSSTGLEVANIFQKKYKLDIAKLAALQWIPAVRLGAGQARRQPIPPKKSPISLLLLLLKNTITPIMAAKSKTLKICQMLFHTISIAPFPSHPKYPISKIYYKTIFYQRP